VLFHLRLASVFPDDIGRLSSLITFKLTIKELAVLESCFTFGDVFRGMNSKLLGVTVLESDKSALRLSPVTSVCRSVYLNISFMLSSLIKIILSNSYSTLLQVSNEAFVTVSELDSSYLKVFAIVLLHFFLLSTAHHALKCEANLFRSGDMMTSCV
jgi:hypothetical protein